MTDIKIPNVGESVSEVTIAQWFKKPGEAVKKDEPLVELETDKAAQELVSPEDGVLEEILVAEGDVATIGQLIAKLGSGAGTTASDQPAEQDNAAAAAAPVSGGASMNIDVPNVGESVSEVTIATWMKQPGDAVAKDEAIVELETDKAAQELVAPEAGVMGALAGIKRGARGGMMGTSIWLWLSALVMVVVGACYQDNSARQKDGAKPPSTSAGCFAEC